jgi:glycosyltransferase involved in cell wall biosynthesis
MNLRILLSAFACDPYFGSDEEVGWQWVRELSSRGHDVTVLTRASHQASIEKCIQETGDCKNVHFVYHDLPTLHSLLRRINRRNQIYYYFWQWSLRKVVKLILREKKFDVIHHITWVSFRQPSFLGGMGVPFYFGPVSGGDEFPLRYSIAFSTKEQFIESARVFLNRLVRWDPFMRRTFQQADKIFLTSRCHLALVPPAAAKKASIELAIASPPTRKAVTRSKQFDPTRPRFLFVGRCIAWKGMDIGLLAFHRILQSTPEATLTVIGDGHERARWEDQANKLGIENSILWKGWIPRS